MLISVVVPVYNTEQTLERTVLSLTNQSYPNIEIILVDDGATDNSGKLCDQLATTDDRIRVIHQANGGLSAARNTGIEAATGDFIAFLDSDDAYTSEIIKDFVTHYEEEAMDVYAFNIKRIYADREEVKESPTERLMTKEAAVAALFQYNGIDFYAWNKIFRRCLFDHVRFPVGKLYEDMNPIYDAVSQCQSMMITSEVGYLYYENTESISQQHFNPRQMDNITERLVLHEKVIKQFPMLAPLSYARILDGLLSTGYKLAQAKGTFGDFDTYDQQLKQIYLQYQQGLAKTENISWQKQLAWQLYTHAPRLYAELYGRYLGKR
ncbi:MAG: glycosyltransferase family 2 protein [Aerococcus sp.]|nr:glycosyltransferase family 2 protein [Aerococcus sp.]